MQDTDGKVIILVRTGDSGFFTKGLQVHNGVKVLNST
jgi:hypothetical protein